MISNPFKVRGRKMAEKLRGESNARARLLRASLRLRGSNRKATVLATQDGALPEPAGTKSRMDAPTAVASDSAAIGLAR